MLGLKLRESGSRICTLPTYHVLLYGYMCVFAYIVMNCLVVHVRKVWEGAFHCMPFLYICLLDHVMYYLLMHLKKNKFLLGSRVQGSGYIAQDPGSLRPM